MADNRNTPEAEAPVTADGPAADSAPELDDAREKLAASERELQDTVTLLKQTRADFENYQKRAARDREEERKYAVAPLARDLLPAFDNLQRAVDAAKQVGEQGPLVQGVAATQAQVLQIFGRHGIKPIEALHQPFDPNRHEAVMQQPSADHPPGTVLQVLQQGFQIHDRVLRPASVIVSTQPNG
jgi:molecular chaperone GrpE